MNLFRKEIKIYIMDKNFETLKEYENIMNILHPKDIIKYLTHYDDLEILVKEDVPDIVILDVDSPYGIITAKKIKELNNKIKIILSSSKDSIALDAYTNGINGYFKKPFTIEIVKETIKNLYK